MTINLINDQEMHFNVAADSLLLIVSLSQPIDCQVPAVLLLVVVLSQS